MKRRVWTQAELVGMDKNEFQMIQICLRAKAYRLLGFNWKKWIRFTEDRVSGDIIIEWE